MNPFTDLIDLASVRLGGQAIAANDEFFAAKDNLLKADAPVFLEGKFTDRGKWMDGWETRRRRRPGHDWCVIRLGVPGIIRGIDVDTTHFKGNFPEACSFDAHQGDGDPAGTDDAAWTKLLPESRLEGDAHNLFPLASDGRWTHVRLNIHPDGGVARLRVHGTVLPDWPTLNVSSAEIDLAAAVNGGLVVASNDMFFGSRHNLVLPGPGANMGDGWETRRKRGLTWTGVEHDWAIVRLGHRGTIDALEVDTSHFKGNFPDACSIDGFDAGRDLAGDPPPEEAAWAEVVARSALEADTIRRFEAELSGRGPWTHLRLKIHPDGGIARFRAWGHPAPWELG